MKRIPVAILSAVAVCMFCISLILPVQAKTEKITEEQSLADLQDTLNCMYLFDGDLTEDEVEWENEDLEYQKVIEGAEDDILLMLDMMAPYEDAEFDDEKVTLLNYFFMSGLHQMALARSQNDSSPFYQA